MKCLLIVICYLTHKHNKMAIINMPFQKNDQVYHRVDFNILSLVEAKQMFANVSYIEFKNACIAACVQHFLIDLYYMHYLVMIGDTVRARNFKLDLEERNIDVTKLVNYNNEERFNFGSVLHSCVTWNNDTTMIRFLQDECGGDFKVKQRFGFKVCQMDWQEEVYTYPFLDILGHGERAFDNSRLFRRNPHNFLDMDRFIKDIDELDEQGDQEREQDENIEVIEPHAINDNDNNIVENNVPRMVRQNAVEFDEDNVDIMGPDYIQRAWDNPLPAEEGYNVLEQWPPNKNIQQMDNELVTIIANLFPDDNDAKDEVIGTLKAYKIFTVEDFIETKLDAGDLEACGIEDQEIIDKIWSYIEKYSPNFVNGMWV